MLTRVVLAVSIPLHGTRPGQNSSVANFFVELEHAFQQVTSSSWLPLQRRKFCAAA